MSLSQAYVEKNVSRETFGLLQTYVALLEKWNSTINLIGKSTGSDIWSRHISDALQLLPLIPPTLTRGLDIGSGAGLPGIVIAIAYPHLHMTLVEQDQRKAAFLRQVIATLSLSNVTICAVDIATITTTFPLITARAFTALPRLCALAYKHREKDTICLFPKGRNYAIEVAEAEINWDLKSQFIPSATQSDSVIVMITHLAPKKVAL